MKMRKFYIMGAIAIASLVMNSCSTSKDSLTYFENVDVMDVSKGIGSNDYSIKIVPNDELKIIITSQMPEATAAYNLPLVNYASSTAVSTKNTPSIQTYMVDKDGDITMPILGKVHVEGKTTNEIRDMLVKEISKDVKDPFVDVTIVGFKVNVLGEVKDPGTKIVTKERYSILDALADAKDLTEYGKRDNVLLIREEGGTKKVVRLNLNDAKLLESSYFYLQQNDAIYVEANTIKQENSKYNQNNGFKLSVVSTIVSACSVIASLIIALVVK